MPFCLLPVMVVEAGGPHQQRIQVIYQVPVLRKRVTSTKYQYRDVHTHIRTYAYLIVNIPYRKAYVRVIFLHSAISILDGCSRLGS